MTATNRRWWWMKQISKKFLGTLYFIIHEVRSFFGIQYLYCFKTFKKSLETLKYNLRMKCPKRGFPVFEIWRQVVSALTKYFSAKQYIYIKNAITVNTCTYKHSYSDILSNLRHSCHMSSTSWNMEVHRRNKIPFTPSHVWQSCVNIQTSLISA